MRDMQDKGILRIGSHCNESTGHVSCRLDLITMNTQVRNTEATDTMHLAKAPENAGCVSCVLNRSHVGNFFFEICC